MSITIYDGPPLDFPWKDATMSGMDPIERWKRKITKSDGCWEWNGATKGGYGVVGIGPRGQSRHYKVHRLVCLGLDGYTAAVSVCHRCDNKLCVRPEHLYAGTPKTNFDDMVRAGKLAAEFITHMASGCYDPTKEPRKRKPKGTPRYKIPPKPGMSNHAAKLTDEQVREIRRMFKPGVLGYRKLGTKFDVDQKTVYQIVKGIKWTHIK